MRRPSRFLIIVVVASTVLGACGGSSKSPDSAEPSESWKPTTVQERLLAETTDEGVLPREAALQLFALQYGPLPGVRTAFSSSASRSNAVTIAPRRSASNACRPAPAPRSRRRVVSVTPRRSKSTVSINGSRSRQTGEHPDTGPARLRAAHSARCGTARQCLRRSAAR